MQVNVKYQRWETVFLRTDQEGRPGMITGHEVREGYILYIVSREGDEVRCYEKELSKHPAHLTYGDN